MPMVQHMLSALERAGCPVDLARHISCDMCQEGRGVEHAGGYDPALNQVWKYFYVSLIFNKTFLKLKCFLADVHLCQ